MAMQPKPDEEIRPAAEYVKERVDTPPTLALVLGSGLGAFADEVEDAVAIPTPEIPGYPRSTVEGHAGRLVFGKVGGAQVMVVQGRVHFYEGYPMADVVKPVRLAAALGARGLVVTNASGGISEELEPGDLMAICDHVNLMGTNPLIGQDWGYERFPDMSRAYDPDLRKVLYRVAGEERIQLKEGVLGAWTGPTYETAAEVKFLQSIGVSAACMSTVPEVITAARLRLRTVGVSCITNMATGISDTPLTHEEVTETAARVEDKFRGLLRAAVPELANAV